MTFKTTNGSFNPIPFTKSPSSIISSVTLKATGTIYQYRLQDFRYECAQVLK